MCLVFIEKKTGLEDLKVFEELANISGCAHGRCPEISKEI